MDISPPKPSPQDLTALNELTLNDLLEYVRSSDVLYARSEKRRKDLLIKAIIQSAPSSDVQELCTRGKAIQDAQTPRRTSKKRRRDDDEQGTQRLNRPKTDKHSYARPVHDPTRFMSLPTDNERNECYRRFYNATCNDAVRFGTCAVCSRRQLVKESGLTAIDLCNLPNADVLRPKPDISHSAHDLTDGLLLECTGLVRDDNGVVTGANVCAECLRGLKTPAGCSPPKYSLANNLWIGPIPLELRRLTTPEQLLIALLYPRVFVFKMWPKKSEGISANNVQRGMRGTVSTFEQDIHGIAAMTAGKLMPRPPAILASVMTVTFIAKGKLTKSWLYNTFRVRRWAVRDALLWLKANNPKYYGDIEISEENLAQLPEDDVPDSIVANVRQSDDLGLLQQENSGYVPAEDEFVDGKSHGVHVLRTQADLYGMCVAQTLQRDQEEDKSPLVWAAIPMMGQVRLLSAIYQANTQLTATFSYLVTDADVIPSTFQISGAVDTSLSNVTPTELMLYGLANLWKEGSEGGYSVRYSRQPVSDFGRPLKGEHRPYNPNAGNFWEKAYPFLFPYGRGGFEADREKSISFVDHVKWALQHHDGRFRRHESFPFLAFGIEQRRQALGSAKIQMRRKDFERDAHILATITQDKLREAVRREELGQIETDPSVRLLRQHLHTAGTRVQGSDAQRYQLRSKIWSTSVMLGPPTLWMTINPSDLHDPVAQVFAGEDIDLDAFVATDGPSQDRRSQNVAEDPWAASKFFHFIINTILQTLFNITVTAGYRVDSGMGVLGELAAYFGTVESQGRGTLHLHILMYLKYSPTAHQMQELLRSEAFREKIRAYIKNTIHAHVPGLESAESVNAIVNEKEIAFSRPPNPDSVSYEEEIKDVELRVARAKQVHKCHRKRCLNANEDGVYVCKRGAPFERSEEDYIKENGEWSAKRLYTYVNAWNPAVTVNCKCNNDCKLITNGHDTKNVTWYITGYSAKKQGHYHNLSAVMAQGHAYHLTRTDYRDSLMDDQRKLLLRVVQSINRQQELSGPMVVAYLMGWRDTKESHHYSPLYWSSFVGALLRAYPSLAKQPGRR